MAIILCLEGLNVKAGTEDIRRFFEGLDIHDGGVFILGGSLKEAFIAFRSEKDAQLAMCRTGDFLKGSRVTLHKSNMVEMEHKLEALLKKKRKPSPTQVTENSPQPHADASEHNFKMKPSDPRTANVSSLTHTQTTATEDTSNGNPMDSQAILILGLCRVLQDLQSSCQSENEAVAKADSPTIDHTVMTEGAPEQNIRPDPGYVRLFGLPPSATKADICQFFKGLSVQEAIVNVKLGINHGCLVKFDSDQDACCALSFNQRSLGSACVEVRKASEKMWTSVLQECENAVNNQESETPKQNPLKETVGPKQKTPILPKRKGGKHVPFKSPKKVRSDCDSAATRTVPFIVKVSNLPVIMTKTEIKELFGCPNIAHKNVLHLLDHEGNRTDTAFLIFNQSDDFNYAMNLHGCHVGSGPIDVSSITGEEMNAMIAKTHPRNLNRRFKERKIKKPFKKKPQLAAVNKAEVTRKTYTASQRMNLDPAAKVCLFVRNLPGDVQKREIKTIFWEYKLKPDNITLLFDSDGRSIGEAVIQFLTEREASQAQVLHSQEFMGSKLLITPINKRQMDSILAGNISGS